MENLKIESERFIRSFLFNIHKKQIIDIDKDTDNYLLNTSYYDQGFELNPEVHYIIWVDLDNFFYENIQMYYVEVPVINKLLNRYKNYSANYAGQCIHFYSDFTIVNKKQLNTNVFWETVLGFTNYALDGNIADIINNSKLAYDELITNVNQANLNKFKKIIQTMPSTLAHTYETKRNEFLNNINSLINEIKRLKETIKELDTEYANRFIRDENNSVFSSLINYITKCKYVNSYYVKEPSKRLMNPKYEVKISLKAFPVSYTYNDGMADKLINHSQVTEEMENKHILLDAVTDRTKFEIYHKPTEISLYYGANTDNEIRYDIANDVKSNLELIKYPKKLGDTYNYEERYVNRHYFKYRCLGSFSSDLRLSQTELNPVRLFATLLQYLQTINLADYAGQQWLYQDHIVLDKEKNELFILTARTGKIEYLGITPDELYQIVPTTYYTKG